MNDELPHGEAGAERGAAAAPLGTEAAAVGTVPPPPPSAAGSVASAPYGRRSRRRRGIGDVIRLALRGLGQTLITLGVVLLLFAVYEVWVSNIFAQQRQDKVHKQFSQAVQAGQDPLRGEDRLNLPSGKTVTIPAGAGFANLYIPHFGKDYAWTIVEGTDDGDLEKGPGHYTQTAVPGQIGNFALAGHRVGKGEPFLNLDQLVPGDSIVVQTAKNWYVYTVEGSVAKYRAALKLTDKSRRNAAIEDALATPDAQGVVGREIVSPTGGVSVIDPVPNQPSMNPTRALMTMTTCHPKYTADKRMIIHASLTRAVPASGTAIPRELAGGTL
jgi:sortase A